MSNIFDALQRAKTERTADSVDALALETELLRIAEQDPPQNGYSSNTASELASAAEPASSDFPYDEFERLPVSIMADSKLVCINDKESLAAEKFRFLAVKLRQLQQTRQLKKVLISSTIPGEGKSMVAANLACTLARRRQRRTLLIDGDLRRPTLARQFGLGAVPGIGEVLQGSSDLSHSIFGLENLGFWILPAGITLDNPLELLQSAKLGAIMQQLAAWFDWIVIDSPPILPLADTTIWARLADGVLIVTRKGVTEKKQLKKGLEVFESSKLLGALLNSSINVAHSDYYHYYRPNAAGRKNHSPSSPGTSKNTDQE